MCVQCVQTYNNNNNSNSDICIVKFNYVLFYIL